MTAGERSVTRLLQDWGAGNKEALDELMPLVYDQLHRLALHCLQSERSGLVGEAYLRLVDSDVSFQDRVHFYAIAARVLRRILVDHARSHNRQKRGGGAPKVTLEDARLPAAEPPWGIIELDDALTRLATHDQRKSEVIELLFFGGLTYDEAAAALNISPATVHRELRMAKAWLHRELGPPRG